MLPSYRDNKKPSGSVSWLLTVRSFVRQIIKNRGTRNVFFFLLLNLSFTFVEIIYGFWTNSLGLIGDGVHMLFDSSALIFSLIASVITNWPPSDRFTYGYGRVESMCGFINSLLLVGAGSKIIHEAIERVIDPPHINTDSLLAVSVAGLLVNLVGIFAFEHGGHGHSHGGGGDHGHAHGKKSEPEKNNHHGHSHAGNSHDQCSDPSHHQDVHKNPLMQGMFLHILADTLGSVGVICSSICVEYLDWKAADPICSLFIAIMILMSVFPLLKSSAYILIQRSPEVLDNVLPSCLQKIQKIEGVEGYSEAHFWEQCTNNYIGTIKIHTSGSADEQKVRTQVVGILRRGGITQTTIEVAKTTQSY